MSSIVKNRARAEEMVDASQERSHLIAQAARDVVWDWDIKRDEVVWTENVQALFGYAPEEIDPQPDWWKNHIHPDDRDRVLSGFYRSIELGNTCWSDEYRFERRDGSFATVFDRGYVVRCHEGKAVRMVGAMVDITALKRTEDALRESDALTNAVIDALSENIAVLDEHGVIVRTNAAWRQFAAASGADAQRTSEGARYLDVCRLAAAEGAPGAAEVLEGLSAVLAGRLPELEREYPCPTDAAEPWFVLRARPLGTRPGVVVSHIDITALKRAEQRMRILDEANRQLALSLDAATALRELVRHVVPYLGDLCIADLADDGTIRRVAIAHADPKKEALLYAIERRFPTSPSGARGVARVMRQGRAERIGDGAEVMSTEGPQPEERTEGIAALGISAALCVPLIARDKTLGALTFCVTEGRARYRLDDVGLAESIAERAALAIDNARLYSELQRAAAAKDQFLSLLAHELRNPMAPILNAVKLLRLRASDDAKSLRPLEIIEHQVAHQARLLDDLLNVTRIARGKILLRRELVDLSRVVRETVEDHRGAIEEAGLTLTLELPEAECWVDGDPTRLAQVIGNLLNNAAKFTHAGGAVTVRLGADATGSALLSVRDTGIGIAPEDQRQIFDAFSHAGTTGSRSLGGLGLGLALVKGLVELHGGDVRAESSGIGAGAELVVTLPLAPPTVVPQPAPPASGERHRAGVGVLIVEDNRDAADTLGELLRWAGYEIEIAYTGREGLAAARLFQPSVVLCDIGLPDLDGYGVARELRRDPATAWMRLIAVSGYGQEADRQRSAQAGFDLHLVKPVDAFELARLLGHGPGARRPEEAIAGSR